MSRIVTVPAPDHLPALLRRAAERHGARDAFVLNDARLSWGALDEGADRVARSLRARGIGRGDRVALWLPKSAEAVMALWGIMRAGAAYVPIDPAAPPARLGYIARDCAVAGLVSREDRRAQLDAAFAGGAPMRAVWLADASRDTPPLGGIPTVPWGSVAAEPVGPPPDEPARGDLAYILYTSGSTGEPKGVMLSHRNAMAFVAWAAETFALSAEDRLSNHAPFHFDLSTFDLFAAAYAGAAMYPVPPRAAAFPAAVAAFLAANRLSVWYCTPSTLVLMLQHGKLADQDLSALRVLLFAGEVMPIKHLRQLFALAPQARFANLYGPTETNVCTWYEVAAPPAADDPLPIGVPCCGDEVLIVDEALAPVAEGAVGELLVHGDTVMQGYWGRPERTARSLQAVAVDGRSATAYRTGDLVRRGADGNLEFIGRRDHQVKTRGYRVELGEVEAALLTHEAVAEAVVLAIPDEEVTNRLVAVVVSRPGVETDAAALKRHVTDVLPRYMVPEQVRFESDLPRTSSGKIDRQTLARGFTERERRSP